MSRQARRIQGDIRVQGDRHLRSQSPVEIPCYTLFAAIS